MSEELLVVGAGVGGTKVVQAALAAGFRGSITLLNGEEHTPYDKPPLSKECLTQEVSAAQLSLWSPAVQGLERARVVDGVRATELDLGRRVVTSEDGTRFDYDRLVLAPGAEARSLPFPTPRGVHTLRTYGDAASIKAGLRPGARVVVIGGGFIGAEVAASALSLGCTVTILEGGQAPLGRVLGPTFGERIARFHRERGVELLTGVDVHGFAGDTHVEGVRTTDGVVPADLVVVGIGARPATDWLESSGLMLGNGILCGTDGSADRDGRVFAVGDAAAWLDDGTGVHRRHEHWSAAGAQASVVGALLAGQAPPQRPTPYFWSDQYGSKIQMVGEPSPEDQLLELHGSLDSDEFVLAFHDTRRVSAIVALGMQRFFSKHRVRFTGGEDLSCAVARAGDITAALAARLN